MAGVLAGSKEQLQAMGCRAKAIGWHAQQLLTCRGKASVRGVTSRGLFVQTSDGALFLSTEAERGPLTINIAGDRSWLSLAQEDTTCVIMPRTLRLLPSGLTVTLDPAVVWRSPRRLLVADSPAEQRLRFARMSQCVPQPPSVIGMAQLSEWIAQGFPEAARPAHPQAERCARLGRAVAEGEAGSFATLIEGLLGWGHGLTPSGDDFIIGLLLALRRAGDARDASASILEAAARLVNEKARERTTAISAGLLGCAALGEADERLIALVDHVQAGAPGQAEAQQAASSWGATSGWDAFAGMGVTLGQGG